MGQLIRIDFKNKRLMGVSNQITELRMDVEDELLNYDFRDYSIKSYSKDWHKSIKKGTLCRIIDINPDHVEYEVNEAMNIFNRDGYSSIIFYLDELGETREPNLSESR